MAAVRPVCDDVRARGGRGGPRVYGPVRRRGPAPPPGCQPRRRWPRAGRARPGRPGRAGGGHPAGPAGARGAAAAPSVTVEVVPGATVTERYVPVGRAGVYVPGGLVAYPSSVVMNVMPAQVAGVGEIAVASPPQAETAGCRTRPILAACALLGVTEVHAAGGAQAIAMFGYGTEDCAPVDVVTGPGNVYVAAAKRLLRGVVAHRRRGRPDRDRDHRRRRRRPGLRRRRPDRPGRARPAGRLPADHHRPRPGRPGRPELAPRSRPPGTATGSGRAGRAVGLRAGGRPGRGAGRRRRLGAEHLEIQAAAPPRWPAGSATPAPSSSARARRCRSATTWPAPTTCCPPAAPPGTPAGCRCCRSCAASTSSSATGTALAAGRAAHRRARRRRGSRRARPAVRVRVPR